MECTKLRYITFALVKRKVGPVTREDIEFERALNRKPPKKDTMSSKLPPLLTKAPAAAPTAVAESGAVAVTAADDTVPVPGAVPAAHSQGFHLI